MQTYKEKILAAQINECSIVLADFVSKERLKQLIYDACNTIICCETYNYYSERLIHLKELKNEAVRKYVKEFNGKIYYRGLDLFLE